MKKLLVCLIFLLSACAKAASEASSSKDGGKASRDFRAGNVVPVDSEGVIAWADLGSLKGLMQTQKVSISFVG